eukprot:jgi/Astpho2/4772/Aster-x0641
MQELHERLAGRNKDDLSYIHQGLAELARQWDVVAADCKAAARDAQEAACSLLKAAAEFDLKLAQEQEAHQQCLQQMAEEADASVQQEHRQTDGLLAEQRRRITELQQQVEELQAALSPAQRVHQMHEASAVGRLEQQVQAQQELLRATEMEHAHLKELLGQQAQAGASPGDSYTTAASSTAAMPLEQAVGCCLSPQDQLGLSDSAADLHLPAAQVAGAQRPALACSDAQQRGQVASGEMAADTSGPALNCAAQSQLQHQQREAVCGGETTASAGPVGPAGPAGHASICMAHSQQQEQQQQQQHGSSDSGLTCSAQGQPQLEQQQRGGQPGHESRCLHLCQWPSQPLQQAQPQQHLAPRWELQGAPTLGGTLQVQPGHGCAAAARMQWCQVLPGDQWVAILGAASRQYSPEPADAGILLGCRVQLGASGQDNEQGKFELAAQHAVSRPPGFQTACRSLLQAPSADFNVRLLQLNGAAQQQQLVCRLCVRRNKLVLKAPGWMQHRAPFTKDLQVCGARGPGSSAAQSMFLAVRQGQAYMLGFSSAQERNICIAIIRARADRHGLYITGPSH